MQGMLESMGTDDLLDFGNRDVASPFTSVGTFPRIEQMWNTKLIEKGGLHSMLFANSRTIPRSLLNPTCAWLILAHPLSYRDPTKLTVVVPEF